MDPPHMAWLRRYWVTSYNDGWRLCPFRQVEFAHAVLAIVRRINRTENRPAGHCLPHRKHRLSNTTNEADG